MDASPPPGALSSPFPSEEGPAWGFLPENQGQNLASTVFICHTCSIAVCVRQYGPINLVRPGFFPLPNSGVCTTHPACQLKKSQLTRLSQSCAWYKNPPFIESLRFFHLNSGNRSLFIFTTKEKLQKLVGATFQIQHSVRMRLVKRRRLKTCAHR